VNDRRSTRERARAIAGVTTGVCGIAAKCSGMNQRSAYETIQSGRMRSNRDSLTGREYARSVRSPRRLM
jgi:hypothetical protein